VDDPKARLVQFLIHVGADVDAADEEGNTALIVAGYLERSAEAVDKCAPPLARLSGAAYDAQARGRGGCEQGQHAYRARRRAAVGEVE
jgi:ankyrin repeat protein